MGFWDNADGLRVKFGTDEAVLNKGGQFRSVGPLEVVEVDILFSDLDDVAVGTERIVSENVTIPNGAHIEKAEFYVEVAFAGATATLDIGLIDQDRTTAIDQDGIDVAIPVASLTQGATISHDGALIGTTLTNTGLITATNDTAAFTAGEGKLRIFYFK